MLPVAEDAKRGLGVLVGPGFGADGNANGDGEGALVVLLLSPKENDAGVLEGAVLLFVLEGGTVEDAAGVSLKVLVSALGAAVPHAKVDGAFGAPAPCPVPATDAFSDTLLSAGCVAGVGVVD